MTELHPPSGEPAPDPEQPSQLEPTAPPSDQIIAGTGEVAVHAANGLDLPNRTPPDAPPPPFVTRRPQQRAPRTVGPVEYSGDDPLQPPGASEPGPAQGEVLHVDAPAYLEVHPDPAVRAETALATARWLGPFLAGRGDAPTATGLANAPKSSHASSPRPGSVQEAFSNRVDGLIPQIDEGWIVSQRSWDARPQAPMEPHSTSSIDPAPAERGVLALVLLRGGELLKLENTIDAGQRATGQALHVMGQYRPDIIPLDQLQLLFADNVTWVNRDLGRPNVDFSLTSATITEDLNAFMHHVVPPEVLRERYPHVFEQ